MSYVVEVDQSGKIGETNKATVVAFADGKERAILVPAKVKRQIIPELRRRGKADTLYLFASLRSRLSIESQLRLYADKGNQIIP